jgi:hypothetical protein
MTLRPHRRWAGLRRMFRLPHNQRRMRQDLDDEMRLHLEGRIEDLVAREGLTPAQAEAEARRRFGDPRAYAREAQAFDNRIRRERQWWERLDTIAQHVRYAWRSVRRRPGFAAAVILTIGLGIGANAATFSVVDRLLFRPPPMLREPSLVHRVYLACRRKPELCGEVVYDDGMPFPRYNDIRTISHFFSRTALFYEAVLPSVTVQMYRRRLWAP